jgi:hypothetical protein
MVDKIPVLSDEQILLEAVNRFIVRELLPAIERLSRFRKDFDDHLGIQQDVKAAVLDNLWLTTNNQRVGVGVQTRSTLD